jgi:LysM repeat protein
MDCNILYRKTTRKRSLTKSPLILATALLLGIILAAGAVSQHNAVRFAAADSGDPIAVGNWTYDQFDNTIVSIAQYYGIDPFIIKGQIMLESAFNQYAQSSQVNAGCDYTYDIGLMQVNPYCNDVTVNQLYDAWTNVNIGTGDDAKYLSEFGSIDLALQAYNIGEQAVKDGQRNWAYSNAVENYAAQFKQEHEQNGGGGGGGGSTYTVQSGDTLYGIGSKLSVNWQTIANANGINYPYVIYVGEQLNIPTGSYTVQSGDTLYSIGQRYGVSWQSIASSNGINYPYVIYQGEQLNIP